MSDVRVALVTAPTDEVAISICRSLLEERLIACGNVVSGVRSLYRWEGSIRDEAEVLLVLKTSVGRVDALVERVPQLHPYDVPEVVVLGIEAGNAPYLDWVTGETMEREQAEGS